MSEEMIFANEEDVSFDNDSGQVWKILSVDDEPGMHEVTKMTLSHFKFDGEPVIVDCVYSAKEAKNYMKENDDVALVLLDIVMETETAGFDVAHYIRDELDNHSSRIVMRTGQPGLMDVEKVIENYDIDGFSEKTDLTRSRFIAAVYSALRSYRDIKAIAECRDRLTGLIESMHLISAITDIENLYSHVVQEVLKIVPKANQVYLFKVSSGGRELLCCSKEEHKTYENIDKEITNNLELVLKKGETIIDEKYSCSVHFLDKENSLHLYIDTTVPICGMGEMIFNAFCETIFMVYKLIKSTH